MQPAYPAPTPTRAGTSRPGRGAIIVGLALLALSLVLGAASIVVGAVRVAAAQADAAAIDAPGRVTTRLDAGRHSLWPPENKNLNGYRVEITGPSGAVEYRRFGFFGSTTRLTRDGVEHRPDGFFDAPTAGEYTVALIERDDFPATETGMRVYVGPSDSYVVDILLWTALGLVLAGVVFMAGLIVLIVGLVRRSRGRRAAGAPPPSSYPASYPQAATPSTAPVPTGWPPPPGSPPAA